MNRWLHNSIHWKPVLKIFFFGSIIFHGTINFLQVENFGTRDVPRKDYHHKGISQVEGYQKTWAKLKPYVSESIFNEVSEKLDIQKNDAEWWRDACVGYFQAFSNKELPAGVRPLERRH